MKVKVGQETQEQVQEEAQEQVPAEETTEQITAEETQPNLEDRLRQAEIEKARLEGELKARSEFSKPADNPQQQLKNQVWADASNLTDDEFRIKWKTEKHLATASFIEKDLQESKTSQRQELAELKAENRMAAKYKDFYEFKSEIDEMLTYVSPEIKQDPERLYKFMEKSYLGTSKPKSDFSSVKGGTKTVDRSRISGGFEKPSTRQEVSTKKEEDNDLIAEADRALARAFGLTSEKERKQYADTSNIPMDLGNGTILVGRDIVKKDARV